MKGFLLRGQSGFPTENHIRGRDAELIGAAWFRARGHQVIDVALHGTQHDLVVSGVGRVQVKTVHLRRRVVKGDSYQAALTGKNATGKTRYAVNAFDALLLVWFGKTIPRCVLVPSRELVASGGGAMVAHFSMGRRSFENRWSTVEVVEALVLSGGKEAKDGQAAPE
jgi:hypothetical protein